MGAWGPIVRRAVKVAPVALEVARQADRQIRPHVLAYRAAREIDGYVARWTVGETTHWLVLPRPDAAPLRAFPSLPASELAAAREHLDPASARHHRSLPEARARQSAARLAATSGRAVERVRDAARRTGPR